MDGPQRSSATAATPATPTTPARRVRVVLAGERRVRRATARREIEEQTPVGDLLVRGLMRAQLGLAIRLSALVLAFFGALPLLFVLAPDLARVRVAGLQLPWLLLGVIAYPVIVGAGWVYVRLAGRNEQEFADLVNRS